jgi:hypothetical protein
MYLVSAKVSFLVLERELFQEGRMNQMGAQFQEI